MNARAYWLTVMILSVGFCPAGWSQDLGKLPITGRVVDDSAGPVEGAEVAVYQQDYRDGERFAELIAPIVKTDRDGQFELQADVTSQYDVFVVARKFGLALAWDGLNYSRNTLGKGHFLLVQDKPCTLTGVVVDKEGRPVVGAAVQAVPKTSYLRRLSQRPILAPVEWFTVKTDTDGRFRFEAFAGDVKSDFWVKTPSLACTYKFTPHYQSCCGYEVGREDVRLVLPREGSIQGRVVNAKTGQPVGGIELTIQADRDRSDVRDCYIAQTVVTDASGEFTCSGLPEGKSKITPAEGRDRTSRWVAESVTVDIVSGQATEDVLISVKEGQVIECVVRDSHTDQSIPKMRASAYCEAQATRGWAMTDEAGIARVYVLPGEHQVSVWGRGYASWSVNEPTIIEEGQTKKVDVLLDKDPFLEGTVVGPDGQPAEDILVGVHPFGDSVYTGSEGHFTAGYDQRRADDGLVLIARDRERALVGVTSTKKLDESIPLSLGPGLIVKGRITDPNGAGIAAARVAPSVSMMRCLCGLGEEVLTDAEGYFELRGLPPQAEPFDYRISVHAAGYAPKTYKRITIEGEPGTTVDLEPIELGPTNMSANGMVVDANGLPAPRTIIFLNSTVGTDQPDKATATDGDGRFAMTRIGKGPIRLQAGFDSDPNGSGYLKAQAGDRDVKIVLGQTLTHERHESLIGKALPDLADLGIDSNSVKTEGKAVLLCFFDMQQRPSRHVITQLTKKAEVLGNKETVTIVVDVSGAEQDELDRWITDRKVPYAAVGLGEDLEKKKLRWGVRALPWLVLTDADHTVQAEGIGLDQLDERI